MKLLLNHTNILRPQYQCVEDFVNIWGANKEITAALQDPATLQATCPYSSAGKGLLCVWHSFESYFPLGLVLFYNPSACVCVCVCLSWVMCVGGVQAGYILSCLVLNGNSFGNKKQLPLRQADKSEYLDLLRLSQKQPEGRAYLNRRMCCLALNGISLL